MIGIKLDYKGVLVAAVVIVGSAWFLGRKVKEVAPDVAVKLDPINPENVFTKYSDRLFDFITPEDKKYLYKNINGKWGAWIYDITHPEPEPYISQTPMEKPYIDSWMR